MKNDKKHVKRLAKLGNKLAKQMRRANKTRAKLDKMENKARAEHTPV